MLKVAISEGPVILATGEEVTSARTVEARRVVEAAGFEIHVFPATGHGGRALESAVAAGLFAGVLDLTTTELAEELLGGGRSAGPDRLTAAALRGVPDVIAPGGLDLVTFGAPEKVPEEFRGRLFFEPGPGLTLMRTTPQENDRLGREIAMKASAARGPVAIVLPLRGLSALDREGQPFWRPEADAALFQSLRNWVSPHVRLVELDLHFNDLEFGRTAAALLLEMLSADLRAEASTRV